MWGLRCIPRQLSQSVPAPGAAVTSPRSRASSPALSSACSFSSPLPAASVAPSVLGLAVFDQAQRCFPQRDPLQRPVEPLPSCCRLLTSTMSQLFSISCTSTLKKGVPFFGTHFCLALIEAAPRKGPFSGPPFRENLVARCAIFRSAPDPFLADSPRTCPTLPYPTNGGKP